MRPVFIGACDRSGTTLLGAMLGTHSNCLCVPESQFIIEALRGSEIDTGQVKPGSVLKRFHGHISFKQWVKSAGPDHWPDNRQPVEYSHLIEWLVGRYGAEHGYSAPMLWIDHTPNNTKYAATLFSLFPNAKMIHLIRDGRAVAASFLKVRWGPSTIDRAALYWLRTLSYGLSAETYYGPDKFLRVHYEDLVSTPEIILKTICAFLDLDYQPEMLKADGFTPPAFTRQEHSLVGRAPDKTRIDAWMNQLSSRQIEIFEYISGDMLVYLGYAPQFGLRAHGLTRRERLVSQIGYYQMLLGNLYNRIRLSLIRDLC